MPMIKRDDAISFAIHAYRAQLALSSAPKTLSLLRKMAPQHGQYVRVLRRGRTLEAVFSREPGFLLGEAVWRYFGECEDLIYCEVLATQQQVLLVVVQSGRVYLDTKLSLVGLRAELAAMSLSDRTYKIYYYGQLAIFEDGDKNFALGGIRYQFIQSLEASVFESLPVHTDIQLQPLELAARSQYLGRRRWWPMVACLLLGCVSYVAWQHSVLHDIQPQFTQSHAVYDLQTQYQSAMHGPKPYAHIQDMLALLTQANALAGWRLHALHWKPDTYQLVLHAQGGSRDALWRWSRDHGGSMVMGSDGVTVNIAAKSLPSAMSASQAVAVPPLASMTQLQVSLLDQLKVLLPNDQVLVSTSRHDRGLQRAHVKVTMDGVSPAVLDLLARTLSAMPVLVQTMVLQQQDALLSGAIDMTLVGRS